MPQIRVDGRDHRIEKGLAGAPARCGPDGGKGGAVRAQKQRKAGPGGQVYVGKETVELVVAGREIRSQPLSQAPWGGQIGARPQGLSVLQG